MFALSALTLFFISTLLFALPSRLRPEMPSVAVNIADSASHQLSKIPVPINPLRQIAHKPPVQSNSTLGEAKWYSDWKWLNPFSSSITLDENRAVLPPLPPRPTIYTFYDDSLKRDVAKRDAENELLLTWRRAWWAQGFKPVILGRAEAMEHPLYESFQMRDLSTALESDIARWLAWGQMGSGILADWLAIPMGPHDDSLLQYLRRGSYPALRRYHGLGSDLLSGEKQVINMVIKEAIENKDLNSSSHKTLVDCVPDNTFSVDFEQGSIALYNAQAITQFYKPLADKVKSEPAKALVDLRRLINSHLHETFLSSFTKGIAVIGPVAEHTTALIEPALKIASLLNTCPDSPIPGSCPPNIRSCKPCDPKHKLAVSTISTFKNSSDLYTIGTVPHPYTSASLFARRDGIDVPFIRRSTDRDVWISAITKDMLGANIPASARILPFKEAVAGTGATRSLWLTPEKDKDPLADLDWVFGFTLPSNSSTAWTGLAKAVADAKANAGKPEKEKSDKSKEGEDPKEDPAPTPKDLAAEITLLNKARAALKSKARQQILVKKAVEAWNLADTEAWRFARAYAARRSVERKKWDEEERQVTEVGGLGKGRGRWY